MKKTALILTATVLLGSASIAAAGPGLSGAQVLQQRSSARPAGMGNAFAASSGELCSIEVNPAGLYDLEKIEILFMHVGGLEGLSTEMLTAAMPLSGLGVMGIQALYRGQPSIDNNVPGEPSVPVKDMVYGLTFARAFSSALSVGLNAKIAALTLGPVDTSALAFDLGAQYALQEGLTLGGVIRNLGTPVVFRSEEDPLPLTAQFGVCYALINQLPHELRTAADVSYLAPDENWTLHLGSEYWFRRVLALRLGYSHSQDRSVQGMSFGVGFRFKAGKADLSLDYALQPQFWEDEDFETENLISLSVKF
ncbi:MAG: PorV/PorQ family protein [candidate division FCPU426 bacterium]